MASFRIASFNVENLLHPGVRFAGRDDETYTKDLYNRKIRWIAGILDAGEPDLVGFQELFSLRALKAAIAASSHLKGATIVAPDLDDNISGDPPEARGPFCGLATKFRVMAKERILDFPDDVKGRLRVQCGDDVASVVELPIMRFQRPVIRVEVELRPGVTAVVFVAHLKSKRAQLLAGEDPKDPLVEALGNTRSLILRAAESVALRSLVVTATEGNKTPVLVLGDLNDDLPAVTTQTIAGAEPYRFLSASKKSPIWDRLLHSVHDIQEEKSYRDVSYTHIYDGRYELLDHIFVSQEFVARNPRRLGEVRNTRIFNDHLQDERLVASPDTQKLSASSDHGIPVTEISWKTS